MKRIVAFVFVVVGAGLVSLVYLRPQPHEPLLPVLDAAGLVPLEDAERGAEATRDGPGSRDRTGRLRVKRPIGSRTPGGADDREDED
ncbi:MAG TPA: hypothetical protein VF196_01050 [Casimicrobiaceae bacterium]